MIQHEKESEDYCQPAVDCGSEDGVLNKDKYEKSKSNLPDDFEESVIDGGCHAYFGSYGPQDGDGTPTISNEEQVVQTADIIRNAVTK